MNYGKLQAKVTESYRLANSCNFESYGKLREVTESYRLKLQLPSKKVTTGYIPFRVYPVTLGVVILNL